ncbi:MAG: hypothetical protein AD742_06445 [Methylibium sp. NZG]|nr:MAG: hypothetical protein AD742_06445 [Methylibium sp. NZG]
MEASALVALHPRLFHMAERGSWPSIRANGLLSSSAALDLHGIAGTRRHALEREHRPERTAVGPSSNQIVLRDQKPMEPTRLQKALVDGTTPDQWYSFLNSKVFLWAEESRLLRLLNARHYRAHEHDVLTIDTASLLQKYASSAWLCHMNSGNTFPMPTPRGMASFKRIPEYPTKQRSAAPAKPVVEVLIDNSIPDIARHVIDVRRMRGAVCLGKLLI